MQSVSPRSSTVDSPNWRQTYEVILNEEVSSSEEFKSDFSINGTPMGSNWRVDSIVGSKLEWIVEAVLFEDYGYQLQVGDKIAICSISRRVGSEWIEVWTA